VMGSIFDHKISGLRQANKRVQSRASWLPFGFDLVRSILAFFERAETW